VSSTRARAPVVVFALPNAGCHSRRPDCAAVYLHVEADNHGAIALYAKHGLQPVRRLVGLYNIGGARKDALLCIAVVNDGRLQLTSSNSRRGCCVIL
jgi:hypothetical protein